MRKIFFVTCWFVLIMPLSLAEKKINVEELKVAQDIIFENYTGSYQYRDSAAAIKGIGRRLAFGLGKKESFQLLLKYSIIHAFDEEEDERGRLNADILSLDQEAKVDHIRNIRLILAGYLESQYQYSKKHAQTLAYFITIYNAVYRGNMNYFQVKYKPVVTGHMSIDDAGLSTKYYQWPGATKIVIPLTEDPAKGNISALSTTELTDQKVTEKLQSGQDKAIDEREEMSEIKKEEIEQIKEKIETKKEELAQQNQQIVNKEQKIVEKTEQAAQINQPKRKETVTQKIEEQQQQVAEEKEQIRKEEEEIKELEEQLAQKEDEIKQDDREIERDKTKIAIEENPDQAKEELLQKEEQLAQKEEALDQREENLKEGLADKQVFGDKLYFLKINEYLVGGHYDNEMYIMDANSEDILLQSPAKNITGRKYDVISDGVIVITHKGQHTTGNYLTLLDRNTLETKYISQYQVFWRSFVEVRDDFIYVISTDGSDYYLGKYNMQMELVHISKRQVYPDSFISFYKNNIYINSERSSILILDKDDLSLKKEIPGQEGQ